MGWIVEIGSGGWPASSAALGVGVWVFFGWCWITGRGKEYRGDVIILFGLCGAAAFAGGFLASWMVGESGLSSLGALAGAALVAAFLPMHAGFQRRSVLDHLVPGGIAGLSVGRLGCLFEGCDFGRITNGGWGVAHEAGSRAWDAHVVLYGLEIRSEVSLAVHPFALYLALWGFVAAGVGEWRRRCGDGPGRASMAAAAIFFAGGGVIEWLREPAMVLQAADGISAYPSFYLMAAVGAAVIWQKFGSGED